MFDFEAMGGDARKEWVAATVKSFTDGKRMRAMCEQRAYYDTNNPAIMERKRLYAAVDGEGAAFAKENKFAANEKISSSFFRDITDQKVQYVAGEGVDINAVDENEAADAAIAAVFDPIAKQMRRVEQMCLTDALVYGRGYAYLQVIAGRVKLAHVKATEVIPVRDDYGELEAVVRYFEARNTKHAEVHTPAKVYTFADKGDGEGWLQTGERWQIAEVMVYGDGTAMPTGGRAWPMLPWFEMQHNNDCTSSLTAAAKSMIRCYDVVVSDFANNLIDLQDVFITIKNAGYGSGIDYSERLELLRVFKMSEEDTDVKTFEVPHQARQVLAEIMRKDIYAALRGIDMALISGGQLTNTAIRALYSNIDLWADQAEWWLTDWVEAVLGAVAGYMGVELPLYNVTFNRCAITDEVAQMDAVARQKGIISDKTLFEAHPLVSDAQAELERIEAETAGAVYANGMSIEPVGVE